MTDFERFKVKEYSLWDLYLHVHQFPYVGRCYAAAKRENADVVTDMGSDEAIELFRTIVPYWDNAVRQLFQHDRPNVSILGNDWNHLHAHLIPRYNSPRLVHGIEFIDPNPNGNYAPYDKLKLKEPDLFAIRDDLKRLLR